MLNFNFRMYIEPQDFLNRVYASNRLENLIKNSNGVISPRDTYKLWKEKGAEIRIESMHKKDLESILRSITNRRGEEPYQKSNIYITRINPSNAYWTQLFVQMHKLIDLGGLVEILKEFGYLGLLKVPAFYLIVDIGRYTFVAVYVPPIVEIRPSYEIIQNGLEILDKIKTGHEREKRVLPGIYGDVEIYTSKVVEEVIKRAEKSNAANRMVDGTHRSWIIDMAGTTIQVIIIEKPEGPFATFPVLREHLIVTREKPSKEYRFIGLNEEAWLNLKEIGIDG